MDEEEYQKYGICRGKCNPVGENGKFHVIIK